MSEDERSEGDNRRHPDTDINAVKTAVGVVASLEIDRHAEDEAGKSSEEKCALQNAFRIHQLSLPPLLPLDLTQLLRDQIDGVEAGGSDLPTRRYDDGTNWLGSMAMNVAVERVST
jgi:hypothetical protein